MSRSAKALALIVCFACCGVAIAKPLPSFKKHEGYESVRTKLLRAGWKPIHALDADECPDWDVRCKGRPEMFSCAGTGLGSCLFLWEKDGDVKGICTVGEDRPVFSGICPYP